MWNYEQATGALFLNSVYVGTGYSGGNEGKNPEGKNNPAMQNVPDIGPLPRGRYRIEAPVNSPTPIAFPLTPASENEMYGRSGFMIHGDSLEGPGCASEGCIIQAKPVRERINASGDCDLAVI